MVGSALRNDTLKRLATEFAGVEELCVQLASMFFQLRDRLTRLLLSPGSNRVSLFSVAKINTNDDS